MYAIYEVHCWSLIEAVSVNFMVDTSQSTHFCTFTYYIAAIHKNSKPANIACQSMLESKLQSNFDASFK